MRPESPFFGEEPYPLGEKGAGQLPLNVLQVWLAALETVPFRWDIDFRAE